MHTQYDTRPPPQVVSPGEGAASKRLAKIATLTFWVPLLTVDVWVITQSGLRSAGFVHAGHLLFGEMVVYLAFWLLVAGIQAFFFSRSSHRAPRKRGAARQESAKLGNAALNRERTGL